MKNVSEKQIIIIFFQEYQKREETSYMERSRFVEQRGKESYCTEKSRDTDQISYAESYISRKLQPQNQN